MLNKIIQQFALVIQQFIHIFTIYYVDNKRLLFENCFNSLKKGGYMVIHLVDKNNFDPILNSGNPLKFVDVQSVAKKRITSSVVKFKKFTYKANFSVDSNDICKFVETFINEHNDNSNILEDASAERVIRLEIGNYSGLELANHVRTQLNAGKTTNESYVVMCNEKTWLLAIISNGPRG